MLEKIKKQIKALAILAVKKAEIEFGSKNGKKKKKAAVKYLVARLPIFPPLRPIVAILLTKCIDEAIEFSVQMLPKGGSDGRNE